MPRPKVKRIAPQTNQLIDPAAPQDSAWLAAIVESSDDAIIGKTLDGVITSWNRGAQRLFGYTAIEIIGQPISKLIPAGRETEESKILDRLRLGERVDHFDTVRVTKDGALVDVSLTISPIRDESGKIVGASKIARNISDQKRAAASRELIEERMRLAVAAAKIGFWDWDLKTGQVVRSPEAAEMVKAGELETIRGISGVNYHPEDRELITAKLRESLQVGKDYQHEFRIIWPDGSIRWIEARGRALYDENVEPYRMLGTVIDITERKRNEELKRLHDAEVAHLSRISTMGNMASGLAHEINQPLGAILNYTGVCANLLKLNPVPTDKLRAALDDVVSETSRAGEIISRIRSFVAKRAPKSAAVDVNELVRESISFVDFELRHQGISMELRIASGLRPVLADTIQIEQVLVNLIHNAMQAMATTPPTRRHMTIETAPAEKGMVQVSVTDTGVGISTEGLKRLFEPFFTTKPEGLGLGLNISRSIVESHGGRLSASTNPKGGMRFSFTLPTE